MGLCGTFRQTFGTRDLKYIIGTVPQESGRVVTLAKSQAFHLLYVTWGAAPALSSFYNPSFASPTLQLFSNPSVTLSMSQLILQHFCCFTYITAHSPSILSLLLCHRLFWRAAHAKYYEEWSFTILTHLDFVNLKGNLIENTGFCIYI